jgi:hypothetical protein
LGFVFCKRENIGGFWTCVEAEEGDFCSSKGEGELLGSDFLSFATVKLKTERDFASSFLLLICLSKSSVNYCPEKELEEEN